MGKIADIRADVRGLVALGAGFALVGALTSPTAQADTRLLAAQVQPGAVVAWGAPADLAAVLTPPVGLKDAVAVVGSDVPGSFTSLALRADGTVVGWGLNPYQEADVPSDLSDVTAIDSGAGFSVALKADGSVVTWGTNDAGQLDVPADLGPVTAISAGGYLGYRGFGVPSAVCGYALALRPDGTVARWGQDREGLGCDQIDARLDPPADLTGVVAISAGSRQALALRSDGTVVAWGSGNLSGLDGTPPQEWSDVVAISAGSGNSVGLRSDGTVYAYGIWGESGPPQASDVAAVAASNIDVFLHRDGTVSAYPGSLTGAPSGSDYRAVAAGHGYGLAVAGPPAPAPSSPVLGSAEVQPAVDSNPSGTAESFQYVASKDATADTFHLYLDETNEAKSVVVGVYSDDAGRPGALLGSGRSWTLVNGAWNAIPVSTLTLEAGKPYWLALLGPKYGGVIRFRDLPHGSGGPTQISAETDLSGRRGLPRVWTPGTDFANSPASAYLS